ncbi:MAG: SMEK domain-containing protein [Gammaproteobacteria bacterium]
MKHIELINQFREESAKLTHEVESSVAMGHFDINKICEDVVCGLFRELYGFENLRNLNNDEKQNFPGIDLADDDARIAIQVTSDKSLDKVKDTLKKFITHKLYEKYDRVIIYILIRKQASYSDAGIAEICGDHVKFDVRTDILDPTDLSTKAATADPAKLKQALDVLLAYMRGFDVGLASEDFDPPEEPQEQLGINLVELYFPPKLFIAEIRPEVLESKKGRKVRNHRKGVKDFSRENGQAIPSDFEASGGRLITFHDMEASDCPFRYLIDEGTIEEFTPSDYYEIDEDHERIFKSLLRFMLQQKLYKQDVMWQHHEGKFIFLPRGSNQNKRTESWTGQKVSSRMVFDRKFKTNKKDEVLSTRHLAFSTDFLRLDGGWYVALTPDWFFSYGDEYSRSYYGDKLLSGLKRMEKNRSVYDQFRFLASWLESIDREDLFSEEGEHVPTISFATSLKLDGARALDEKLWEPLSAHTEDELQERLGIL